MTVKPTYEELEKRVQELEKIESEHKYSKEALRENENLFKMLYEKAPLGYQSLDENGCFLVVNQTWLETLGYTKEEVIGRSFADFLHPDWRDHFKKNFPRFKSIGEVLGVEFEMVKKNGDLILVSFTGKISRDKTGNFQQTHCIFHDITERKRAEEALREREGKYRLLFNMGVNAMFLVDNDTTQILECNNKASQLFGYSSRELLSMKMTDLSTTPEATRRACQENVSKMERVYQRKDGGLISVDITSEHFYLADRAVHISAIRDITDKKLAEKALQEKTQFLQKIIDTTSELLSVTDMEGNFKFIGPSHSILGYELDSLVGRNVMEFVHPDDYQETATAFAEFLANMEDGRKVEYRYRRSDGEYLWFETVGKFILDDAGNPKQILFSTRDVTERKQAEEALIEREALFRGMFNDHSAVMLLIDPNTGQIIKANQAAVQYYGYPLEKMLQMKIQQLNILSPEHVAEQMHSASKKQINIFEFQHMLADGQVRDVEVHSAPITIQHQTLLFSIIHDITERNQAEATLRESEERIRTIGDNLQGAQLYQFRVAPDGGTKFTYVSSKVEELHECKPEDVLKDVSLLFKRVHPADVDEWQKRTHKSLKELTTYDHTVRIVRKSGEIRWHRMISKPRKLDDGSVLFDGVELDVTERKQVEAALKESENLYRTLLSTMPDLIVQTDLNGDILFVNNYVFPNPKFISQENLLGKNMLSFIAEKDQLRALENTKLMFEHSLGPREYQFLVDGAFMDAEVNGDVIHDAENNPKGMVFVIRDITERKQAEAEREKLHAQLNQAQKMESVGRLAGGVAHDFNNMLGVILGHTELALLQADEHHELHGDLKEIQKAAKRSADITKQLLAFARKQTISPRQLDLNDTVESMLNMLRRLIGEDIDLVWKPSVHLWPVKMDPSQIDQILANLSVNARDAIEGVGKLTIETGIKSFDEDFCSEHKGFVPGNFVMLAVSDNGCGMDKDTLNNLFEPFFTTKDVGKGTGLGLATIYGIVKQNNGFINVSSEPGHGSTFKIYLPRLVVDEDLDKAMPEKKATVGGSETILLVEDEPSILRMTRKMLERKGYSVLPAATPGEAIDLAKTHSDKIHLLMTDVVMPEMNGRDLAGQLIPLYPEIKFLFMSGYTANVIAHHGILDEGVTFIQKPFSMADLMVKIREVLDKKPDETHV